MRDEGTKYRCIIVTIRLLNFVLHKRPDMVEATEHGRPSEFTRRLRRKLLANTRYVHLDWQSRKILCSRNIDECINQPS
jgi:hypothetical protein